MASGASGIGEHDAGDELRQRLDLGESKRIHQRVDMTGDVTVVLAEVLGNRRG